MGRLELHCRNNPRCEACPIERLPSARDRVMAGDVVAASIPIEARSQPYTYQPDVLQNTVQAIAEKLHVPNVVPEAVGAAAIVASGLCKINQLGVN